MVARARLRAGLVAVLEYTHPLVLKDTLYLSGSVATGSAMPLSLYSRMVEHPNLFRRLVCEP
jgi:hypothetical protein